MHTKTIVLELLQGHSTLHERLRQERMLLTAVETCSMHLKARHEFWMTRLRRRGRTTSRASFPAPPWKSRSRSSATIYRPRRRTARLPSRSTRRRRSSAGTRPPPERAASPRRQGPTGPRVLRPRSARRVASSSATGRGEAGRRSVSADRRSPLRRPGPPATPLLPPTPEHENDRDSVSGSDAVELASSGGAKAKARDILAAIRTLQRVERERRLPDQGERKTLARFGGFGAVALSLFPDPVTGRYKDAVWQALGEELAVAPHARGVRRVPSGPPSTPSTPRPPSSRPCTRPSPGSACPTDATVLEPGCGSGQLHGPRPRGDAVHRRRTRLALGPHRPGPPPRATTSASRTSATPGCPRAASTPSSATRRSPT